MKLGIITLATGEYHRFLNAYLFSFNKYFFPNYTRKFVYLTDNSNYISPIQSKSIFFQHEKWPKATLNKPKAINLTKEYLSDCDIIFWADVDLNCIDFVTNEEDVFPNQTNKICCVEHCGWLDENKNEIKLYPYETNKLSTAYVEDIYKVPYHQACFFGGFHYDFYKMTKTIEENINCDLEKNFIAVWHDESHLNKYFQTIKPKSIPKIYARPEAMGQLLPNTKIKSILKDESRQ